MAQRTVFDITDDVFTDHMSADVAGITLEVL